MLVHRLVLQKPDRCALYLQQVALCKFFLVTFKRSLCIFCCLQRINFQIYKLSNFTFTRLKILKEKLLHEHGGWEASILVIFMLF